MHFPLLRSAQEQVILSRGAVGDRFVHLLFKDKMVFALLVTAPLRQVIFWTSLGFLEWQMLRFCTVCKLGLSCRPSFTLKPEKYSLCSQLSFMLAFGKVRVHEKDDTPITSTLSAVRGQTCLMHYDSEACLRFFFYQLLNSLHWSVRKAKGPEWRLWSSAVCVCSVLKDENFYQRDRKITSSLSFVLMRTSQ